MKTCTYAGLSPSSVRIGTRCSKPGEEGLKEFRLDPGVFGDRRLKTQKDVTRYGFEAPGAADKIRLYDPYLHKMEDALVVATTGWSAINSDRGYRMTPTSTGWL